MGRTEEASDSVQRIGDQQVNMTESIKTSVSGELLFSMFFRHI